MAICQNENYAKNLIININEMKKYLRNLKNNIEEKHNIDPNTTIACLTYKQFIDAVKEVLEEPIQPKKEL